MKAATVIFNRKRSFSIQPNQEKKEEEVRKDVHDRVKLEQKKFETFWEGIGRGVYSHYNRKHIEPHKLEHGEIAKKREIARKNGVFSPDHPAKITWDIILGIFVLYVVIMTPIQIGFDLEETESTLSVLYLVIALFAVDMVISFNTAYFDSQNDKYVYDREKIAKHYLQLWFWIDLFSTIPFDLVIGGYTANQNLQVIRMIRFFRLFRVIKFFHILKRMTQLSSLGISPQMITLTILMARICFLAHIYACFWHYITLPQAVGSFPTNWIDYFGFEHANLGSRYVASLYYIIVTMLTVGFGDIYATNQLERMYAIFTMITGSIIFGALISKATTLIDQRNPHAKAFQESIQEFKYFINETTLPLSEKERIKTAYSYYMSKKSLIGESNIFDNLSKPLLNELFYDMYREYIEKIRLFKFTSDQCFVVTLLKAAKPFSTLPEEILFDEGDVCNDFIFLKSGSVRVAINDGQKLVVVGMVSSGNYFGDAEFYKNICSIAQYSSVERCEMLTVSHQAMNEALGENSMMNEVFTKYCKKRYKALSHVLRSKTKVEAPSLSQPKTLRKRSTTLYSKGELLNSKAILWVDGKLSDHLSTFDTLEMKHQGKPGDDSEVLYDTVRILRFENGKRIFSEEKTSIFHENYIINPSGTYRMAWDAFVGSLVFYTSLIVPVEIAFAGDAFDQTGAIGYLIDGFFFIDIILNFRTAIRSSVDENAIIISPQAIAERYLRSWFVVDFISAIPFDAILSQIVGENSASFGSLLKIFRAVRLLRLMRIFKFQYYVQQLEAMFGIPPAIFNLLRLLVEVYMFVHWVSCLWWGITSVMTHHPWYTKSGPDGFFWGSLVGPDAKISAKYLVSTYFTFASITTTGYGDIHPIHPLERLLCIFLVLAGASIFTYMIARLSQILSTLSSHSFSSGEKIATIREFLKERQAPKSLRGRIVDHFTRQFKDSSSYDITTIVDRLPQYLGNKILFNIYEKFILKISFFKYIKKQSVQLYLFRLLRPVYYEANHYLFKEGEEAVELIFIISGTVRMFRKLKQPEVKLVKPVEEDWFAEKKRDELGSEKNSFENDNNTESDSNNNSLKNNHHLSIDPTLAERTYRRGPTSARTTPGSKYFSLSLGSRFFASNFRDPGVDGATTTSQSAAALPETSGSGGSLRLRGILAGAKKKAVSFSNFRTDGPAPDPLTKTQHSDNGSNHSSVKASSANNDSGPRESMLTSQKTRRKVKSGRRFSLKRQGSTQSDDDIHEHQTLYANLAELRNSTGGAYDHLDRFDRPFNQLESEDFRLLNFELIGDLTVGDFLGHNAHMINEGKHVTSARTIDHATVYTLSHYEISKLVRVEPTVGIQLQNALTQAIIAQTDSVGRYLHRRRRGDFLKQVKQDYDRAKSRGGVQLPKLNSENLRAREFHHPRLVVREEEEKADDVEEAGELHQHYSADQLDDFRLPVDTLPPPAKENSLRKKLHRQLSARLTQIKLPRSAPTTPAQRERKKISFAAEAPDGPQLPAPPAENITVTRKFQTDSHLLVARKKRPSLSGEEKSGGADGDDFGHFHLSNAKQAARVRALDEMFHKRRIYYDSDADSESEQPQRTRTKRFELLRDRSKILRRTNSSESLVGPDDKPLPAADAAVSPATAPPSSLRSRLAKFFSRKKTVRRGSGGLYALASTRPRTDSAEALELIKLHGATPIEEEKEAQSRKKQKGGRRPSLKHFSSTNRDEFHAKVRRRSYSLNDLTEKELLFRRSLENLFRSSAPPSSGLPTSPMSPTSPTFLSPSGSNYGQLLGHRPFSLDLQDEDLGSKKVQASDSVKEIEFGLNNNYIERRSRRRLEPGETEAGAGAGAGVAGKKAAGGREEATAEEFNPLIHKKRRQSFPSYDFPEWRDDRLHRFIL